MGCRRRLNLFPLCSQVKQFHIRKFSESACGNSKYQCELQDMQHSSWTNQWIFTRSPNSTTPVRDWVKTIIMMLILDSNLSFELIFGQHQNQLINQNMETHSIGLKSKKWFLYVDVCSCNNSCKMVILRVHVELNTINESNDRILYVHFGLSCFSVKNGTKLLSTFLLISRYVH